MISGQWTVDSEQWQKQEKSERRLPTEGSLCQCVEEAAEKVGFADRQD